MVRSLWGHFFCPRETQIARLNLIARIHVKSMSNHSPAMFCASATWSCSDRIEKRLLWHQVCRVFTVFTKLHVWCGDQKIATSVCSISFICSSSLPLLWLLQEPRQPFQKFTHWWHGLCKLLHSKLLLHVHYYSLLILIHRYTQHPATQTLQGSRPRQQDLYDLDGYRRMQSFLRKLILQHVCSTRHLQTPSNCMKNSGNLRHFMPFMPFFWPNRRLESSPPIVVVFCCGRWPNFVGMKSWGRPSLVEGVATFGDINISIIGEGIAWTAGSGSACSAV